MLVVNKSNKEKANGNGYISLAEAAKLCSYSQDYLSLLARRNILKSKKFGRNWFTRKEWLEEYVREHSADKKGNIKGQLFNEQKTRNSLNSLWLNLNLQKLYSVIIDSCLRRNDRNFVVGIYSNILIWVKKKYALYNVNLKFKLFVLKNIYTRLVNFFPAFFIWKNLTSRKIISRVIVLAIIFCLGFSCVSAKIWPTNFLNLTDGLTQLNQKQTQSLIQNLKFVKIELDEIKSASIKFSHKIFNQQKEKLFKSKKQVAGAQTKKINLNTKLVNNFFNQYKLASVNFLNLPNNFEKIFIKNIKTKWLQAGARSQLNPSRKISQNLLNDSSESSKIVKIYVNKIFKACNQFSDIIVKNIFNPLSNSGKSIGNSMLKVAQNFGEILADTIMPWTKYHSDTQDAIMKLAQRKSGITNLTYQGDYVVNQLEGSKGKEVIILKGEKGDTGEKGEQGDQGLQGPSGSGSGSGNTYVNNIYNVGTPGTTAKQGAGTSFATKYLSAGEFSVSGDTNLNTLTVGSGATFESTVSIAGALTASSGLSTSNISGSGYLSIGSGTPDWTLQTGDGYFSDDLEVDGSIRIDSSTTTEPALLITSSSTTPQLTVRYDTDHQWQSSVDNKGNLTWDLTSATNTPEFLFTDPINISTSTTVDVFGITASTTQSIFSITASSSAPLVVFNQTGAGDLLDFQVAGTRYFSLANDGDIFTAGGLLMAVNSTTAISIQDSSATTHFVIDTTQGHYGFATSSPADGYGLTIATSTLQYGDWYNFGNATTSGTGVFSASLSVATTTHPYALNVSGSGYFTDGLMIAGYTTTSDLYIQGNATTSNSFVAQNDVTLGDAVTDRIAINSYFLSDLIPADNTRDVGSSVNRWSYGYFDSFNVNTLSAGGTDISGTASNEIVINSTNATNDAEDASIVFERGAPVTNAAMRWDASENNINFNFPIWIEGTDSGGNASSTITVKEGINQGGVNLFQIYDVGDNLLVQADPEGHFAIGSSYQDTYGFTVATTTYFSNDVLINTNATTTGSQYIGGDLAVAGTFYATSTGAEFNSATITDTFYLGGYQQFIESGDNYIYFVNAQTNYFAWDDNPGEFAKLVKNFIDEHKNIELKSLAYKGNELDLVEIKKLASLPTYEEAISRLMSVMQAPIQKLMATVNAVPAKMVRTLDAVKQSKN